MMSKFLLACLGIAAVLGLASCEKEGAPMTAAAPSMKPPVAPNQHWVAGDQLKKVMSQVAGLREAIPRGVPEDPESPANKEVQQALVEAAALADALADTAQRIPSAIENKPLAEADRRGFVAEASTLHDQAVQLRDAAKAKRVEEMQEVLNRINGTCISCHSRYRDFSGELNAHKAMGPAEKAGASSVSASIR